MELKVTTPRLSTSQEKTFNVFTYNHVPTIKVTTKPVHLKGPCPYDDTPRNEYGGAIGRDC